MSALLALAASLEQVTAWVWLPPIPSFTSTDFKNRDGVIPHPINALRIAAISVPTSSPVASTGATSLLVTSHHMVASSLRVSPARTLSTNETSLPDVPFKANVFPVVLLRSRRSAPRHPAVMFRLSP